MLDYFKRIIIVTNTPDSPNIKGSVKLVKEGELVTLFGDFILKSEGLEGCACCVSGDSESVIKKIDNACKFSFNIDKRFTFYKGASFCIFNKSSKKILCYGESGIPYIDKINAQSYIKNNIFEKEILKGESELIEYDDELIATENYYGLENEELLRTKARLFKNSNNEKEAKKETQIKPNSDEEGSIGVENLEYYRKIEKQLNNLLKTHKKEQALNDMIKGGEFVKINYGENKEYYVGKIVIENVPKFILYGVRGSFSSPPYNFSYSKFIPESHYDLEGRGYYMIFQSVHTGEIIK